MTSWEFTNAYVVWSPKLGSPTPQHLCPWPIQPGRSGRNGQIFMPCPGNGRLSMALGKVHTALYLYIVYKATDSSHRPSPSQKVRQSSNLGFRRRWCPWWQTLQTFRCTGNGVKRIWNESSRQQNMENYGKVGNTQLQSKQLLADSGFQQSSR